VRARLDYGANGGIVAGENDGDVRFDDAGFFRGNLLDGIAEPIAVIEANSGNDGEFGPTDVRRIEASAEATFENGVIDAILGIEKEGNGREGFKKREIGRGERGHACGETVEGVVGGEGVIEAKAFVQANEMGARVTSDTTRKAGGENGANGALSIRAGDMNGGKIILRIAEGMAKRTNLIEARPDAKTTSCGKIVEEFHNPSATATTAESP